MGQYFTLVNKTKKQRIEPHGCGNGAKFREIVGSFGTANVLAYLLRQSSQGGGGDIPLVAECEDLIETFKDRVDEDEYWKNVVERYKAQLEIAKTVKFAGSWAGDRITLIGDYDETTLAKRHQKYKDITSEVIEEIERVAGISILKGAREKKTLTPDMVFTVGG